MAEEKFKWLLRCCGGHLKSLELAVDVIKERGSPDVPLRILMDKTLQKLERSYQVAVRKEVFQPVVFIKKFKLDE